MPDALNSSEFMDPENQGPTEYPRERTLRRWWNNTRVLVFDTGKHRLSVVLVMTLKVAYERVTLLLRQNKKTCETVVGGSTAGLAMAFAVVNGDQKASLQLKYGVLGLWNLAYLVWVIVPHRPARRYLIWTLAVSLLLCLGISHSSTLNIDSFVGLLPLIVTVAGFIVVLLVPDEPEI